MLANAGCQEWRGKNLCITFDFTNRYLCVFIRVYRDEESTETASAAWLYQQVLLQDTFLRSFSSTVTNNVVIGWVKHLKRIKYTKLWFVLWHAEYVNFWDSKLTSEQNSNSFYCISNLERLSAQPSFHMQYLCEGHAIYSSLGFIFLALTMCIFSWGHYSIDFKYAVILLLTITLFMYLLLELTTVLSTNSH